MDPTYEYLIYDTDRATTPTPDTPKEPGAIESTPKPTTQPPRQNLQTEFQETFKVISNSPWGARLGGLWGNVRKQGETYYEEARKEAEAASQGAVKGFSGLRETLAQKAKELTVVETPVAAEEEEKKKMKKEADEVVGDDKAVPVEKDDEVVDASLQANETFIARFKSEAAKRLKEVQKAEDAADEALLRFGTNVRNFLRDAVTLAPPEESADPSKSDVLFESKSASGKRVIHTSRFDAQLHVIHTSLTSFSEDPLGSGEEWESFKKNFDLDKKTDAIAEDLEKYEDLRRAMEKLVPEQVEYKDFWTRYYFLRHVVEAQEEKRKEMLKASTHDAEEEVRWDEDSDEDEAKDSDPTTKPKVAEAKEHKASDSVSTLNAPAATIQSPQTSSKDAEDKDQSSKPSSAAVEDHLKPTETPTRRSHDEKSVADSDASYDLVSGATSRTPGSPNHSKPTKVDESDEEEWE